jgi:hypothetical protein
MSKMKLDAALLMVMGFDAETAGQIAVAVNSHNDLLRSLKEVHAEEIENGHFGDDLTRTPCSYCAVIAQAEARP